MNHLWTKEDYWYAHLRFWNNIQLFPREFGLYRTQVYKPEYFFLLASNYNRNNCYTSVYSEWQIENNVYDTLFFEGRDETVDLEQVIADRDFIRGALEKYDICYRCFFSVGGNTPILVKDGAGNISLIPISEAVVGQEVLTLNIDNEISFEKIYDFMIHPTKGFYRLRYEHSREPIIASSGHSFYVLDVNSLEVITKQTNKLSVGDYLITYRPKHYVHNDSSLKEIEFVYDYVRPEWGHKIEAKKEIIPLDENFCYLLGLFAAEGHTGKNDYSYGLSFGTHEKDLIEKAKMLVNKYMDNCTGPYTPNITSSQLKAWSQKWNKFLRYHLGDNSHELKVPSFMWNVSKDLFLPFLIGWLDGDGKKTDKRNVIGVSVSKDFLVEMCYLCKMHGIECGISLNDKKNNSYNLMFTRSSLENTPYYRETTHDVNVNRYPLEPLKKCYRKGGLFDRRDDRAILERTTLLTIQRSGRPLIEKILDRLKDIPEELRKRYLELFEADYGFVKIRNIEYDDSNKLLYDISVENSERFFGGDYPILLHNSGNRSYHFYVDFPPMPVPNLSSMARNFMVEMDIYDLLDMKVVGNKRSMARIPYTWNENGERYAVYSLTTDEAELDYLAVNGIITEPPVRELQTTNILKHLSTDAEDYTAELMKPAEFAFDGIYPDCVLSIMDKIHRYKHAGHQERIHLASYLFRLGHSMDEIVDAFRETSDFNPAITQYQVYGIMGANYRPYSCARVKREMDVCPYRGTGAYCGYIKKLAKKTVVNEVL